MKKAITFDYKKIPLSRLYKNELEFLLRCFFFLFFWIKQIVYMKNSNVKTFLKIKFGKIYYQPSNRCY